MLTEPTLDRLRALRLGAMADAYRAQLQDSAIGALRFDERVGLLVDAEHLSRDNRKLARRLQDAKLRVTQACPEDLDYAPRRALDRPLIRQGQHACRQGYRTIYRRLPRSRTDHDGWNANFGTSGRPSCCAAHAQ